MQKKEIDDLNDTIKWFKTVRRNNDMACILPDHQMIKNIIKWLEKLKECESRLEAEWIPVDEKLPDVSGTYQVTCMDGRIYRSTYAKFQCKLKRWELTGARSYWKVIAWMQLPKPYEEAE